MQQDRYIRVRMRGGLGNQLFMYACGYALAKAKQARLILNIDSYRNTPDRSYMLEPYNIDAEIEAGEKIDLIHRLLRKCFRPVGFYSEKNYCFNPEIFNLQPPVLIDGNFCSEKYFLSCQDDIRTTINYSRQMRPALEPLIARAQAENSVSIHVRRGDFQSAQYSHKYPICGLPYYHKALNVLEGMIGTNNRYLVFTDDVAWVKENFTIGRDVVIASEQTLNEYEDLQLMRLCHHNITANSTFSWWGAWLGQRAGKIVIAPRQVFSEKYLRSHNICDFYPDDWVLL